MIRAEMIERMPNREMLFWTRYWSRRVAEQEIAAAKGA